MILNETIEDNDATVHVVEQNGHRVYGKTVDSDGSGYVWMYDGESIEWMIEPHYYLSVKTEEALDELDLL